MAIIVSDTSPLRAFANLGILEVLHRVFDEVIVPPAVAEELLAPPKGSVPLDVYTLAFVQVRSPANAQLVRELLSRLDRGEAEAIALAVELPADRLLIDEARGRRVASRHGIQLIGVLGVLLVAKERGLVTVIAPLISRLQVEHRFFLDPSLIAATLGKAGEGAISPPGK